MNQVIENIKTRRSIRKYQNKAIPGRIVKEITEAARFAPSSHNSQPWRFIVITNRKKIKETADCVKGWFKKLIIMGRVASLFYKKIGEEIKSAEKRAYTDKDLFLYDAPLVVLVCSKPGRFHAKDCSCAAQNMMLAANSLGIGSCWIGFADLALNKSRAMMENLGVPKGHEIMATLAFGYPVKKPDSALPRKEEAGIIKWIK